eukprot:CAMPEP_0196719166 /NCGR_PEP_ID=MMETSP1091-20130531/2223_1 /TAXON_ID=302021 /ORGANISM="Rhodomonas sp., Strain CCMP768" /LENGTH=195 /DNA_ID=CAMNT_0042060053 /DNA_START=16 /DNA_END=603 /DNA_ORIENTATION=+
MAFFGITSLGPPNMFSLYKHGDISGVSKEDFFAAFRFIAGGKGTVTKEQIKDVLYEALGGTESDNNETEQFVKCFEEGEEYGIEQFEDILDAYNAEQLARPSKEYNSVGKLREDRVKHKRCTGHSHEKFHTPLTTSMEYGWGDPRDNFHRSRPPCGKMFAHRPSFMSYYAEAMVCFEEGRDLCAGPTMKAMEPAG